MVQLEMENGGVITLRMDRAAAPNTVNNFLSLCDKGFYDGLCFHRVIPGFMIQGGCPNGDGTGGPGYSIRGEFKANGVENNKKHRRSVISMARAMDPDSAGSQFFIMHGTAPHLDGQYAAFGEVVEGMEVVDGIASVRTDMRDRPKEAQRIKKITLMDESFEAPEICPEE